MNDNKQKNGRLSITLPALLRPKVEDLQQKLGKGSAAKALEALIELYLSGQLRLNEGQGLDETKTEGKKEVLKPIADYLALILNRSGLNFETAMIEAAIGSAAGVTSATHEHFDLPLDLMMQVQGMVKTAHQEASENRVQVMQQLEEMNKTLKAIAVSTEITTMRTVQELQQASS